ncbi:DNA mismatch repair endonuclease MutL [Methanospirillum sp.]|uniref:DNA mismatch repair endonuclease MutL n=1 Tax=Methanospirillum sp. TaxID=45200 RepID=UPI002984EF5C|nr:DNA mismatch repair endonuclease MutL [Methanospirillum sp.]
MIKSAPYIKVLDESIVHLIAAGEVVDRPVSIVKELVENAIDALSSRITVELSTAHGVISRIRITDDGIGIPADQISTAFLPHATSKIRTGDDLLSCLTLGFRGEALASIAAVSYVTMVTKPKESETAVRFRITGGEVVEHTETGAPDGTSITVEEIFFNMPARRKFLKSLQTEVAHITSILESFACLYPGITFRYLVNGLEKFSTHGGSDLPDIFRALYPAEAGMMIPVRGEDGNTLVTGLISLPKLVKQNRQRFLLAVNGRLVQSPAMISAVKRAYGSLIPGNVWPVAVLMLEIPPAEVDANIHPTKREVRFSAERKILDLLVRIVRKALDDADLLFLPVSTDENTQLFLTDISSPVPVPAGYETIGIIPVARQVCEATLAGYRTTSRQLLQTRLQDNAEEESVRDERFPDLFWIGQVGETYIIAGDKSGALFLIDQHAAHERVRYDQLKRQESQSLKTQELIAPVVLNMSPSEAGLLPSVLPVLSDEGFIIEPFGQDTWCVRGVPIVLGRYEDPQTVRELIGTILSEDEGPVRLKEQVLRLVACRSAVKAGAVLTPEQGMDIINQLSQATDPWTCPHGRPTIISFSCQDLAKMFKRV